MVLVIGLPRTDENGAAKEAIVTLVTLLEDELSEGQEGLRLGLEEYV